MVLTLIMCVQQVTDRKKTERNYTEEKKSVVYRQTEYIMVITGVERLLVGQGVGVLEIKL